MTTPRCFEGRPTLAAGADGCQWRLIGLVGLPDWLSVAERAKHLTVPVPLLEVAPGWDLHGTPVLHHSPN